jgi:NADPH:quinone reductase-like Zn-dependent oxidoreductase
MKAIVVTDEAAGTAGMTLVERPEPEPAINDVVVQVHASGFTSRGKSWPEWSPPSARARRGCRWDSGCSASRTRIAAADLAEYVAIEARNLAPLPGDVDFTVGASLPISGLTAWQGLFEHGRLQAGQSVLVHGAAGAVGTMVTQLAREFGAYVIGTGRAADRQKALDFGAQEFVDLENDALEDLGGVDPVFEVIGGGIQNWSAGRFGLRATAVAQVALITASALG